MAESPYQWETVVVGNPLTGLYISVDCLMDLRNKMGQYQQETNTPDACLSLLDYLIRASHYTYQTGRNASP
jgi:hypothetical protein